MTIDKLKNSRRPATASPANPTGRPAQLAKERMRRYRNRRRRAERTSIAELGANFVRTLVDLANRNEANMDGTMEPVRRIVAEGDVAFAVWHDPNEQHGVGSLVVKGEKLLKEFVASQTAHAISYSAFKCICAEQAVSSRCLVIGITTHKATPQHQVTYELEENLNLSDSRKAQSAAERMRAYRRRRRHGFRCVEVQVGQAEVDGLVAKGYLASDKRHDLHAIQLAVNDLLFDWLQQT